MNDDIENDIKYFVVTNDEEQYSIWPCLKPIPNGWKGEGYKGLKQECLSYIESVWKDMRPLTLRKQIKEREQLIQQLIDEAKKKPSKELGHSSLIKFLIKQQHTFSLHVNEQNESNFKNALEKGIFHIILQTDKNEICLKISFDSKEKSEFKKDKSQIPFSGYLEVDFVPLFCTGNINKDTKKGCCKFNIN